MRFAIAAVLLSPFTAAPLAAQQPARPPVWDVTLGAGAVVTPSYAGADEYQAFPFPLTQVTWRNRVYLGQSNTGGGAGLGAYAIRTARLGLAVELGFLQNRPASRADALAGMQDRDFVATAGASLSYLIGPVQASLSASQGLNDGAGLLGSARLGVSQALGRRVIASVGAGATFANARQMRWDFGVTASEAARRRDLIAAGDRRLETGDDRAYRPDAGLRQVGASLSLTWLVTSHWAVVGFGGVDRLSDEAAASPLVRRRAQVSGGAGLGYRF